jgi:hypothetical protein
MRRRDEPPGEGSDGRGLEGDTLVGVMDPKEAGSGVMVGPSSSSPPPPSAASASVSGGSSAEINCQRGNPLKERSLTFSLINGLLYGSLHRERAI